MNKIDAKDYYANTRPEIRELLPHDISTILDIGCGEGNFGKEIVKNNNKIEVSGIEPVTEIYKIAKKNLNGEVYNGTIQDKNLPFKKNYFDVVTMNDVLEHIWEPELALAEIKELLNSNGILVLSLPNVLFIDNVKNLLIKKDWKYENSGILDKTHMRFYTKKSMIRLLEDSGYKIKSITGINKVQITPLKWFANFVTFGYFEEFYYLQFAIVATKN